MESVDVLSSKVFQTNYNRDFISFDNRDWHKYLMTNTSDKLIHNTHQIVIIPFIKPEILNAKPKINSFKNNKNYETECNLMTHTM